jgi:hypothetical protein
MYTKSPCAIQRELQAVYLTAVEKVGVAQRKYENLTIGMAGAASKTLLEELKEDCSVALLQYAKHRQQHPC